MKHYVTLVKVKHYVTLAKAKHYVTLAKVKHYVTWISGELCNVTLLYLYLNGLGLNESK